MIKRLKNFAEMARYSSELARIHKECFSAPPWNFAISEREALMTLKNAFELPNSIFCVDAVADVVFGAAIASPLKFHPEISSIVQRKKGDIIKEAVYCQWIFVDPKWQHDRRGSNLHETRLFHAKQEGFKYAVQRTSHKSRMYQIIKKTGFEEIGHCKVLYLRDYGDGKKVLAYDTRVISIKEL